MVSAHRLRPRMSSCSLNPHQASSTGTSTWGEDDVVYCTGRGQRGDQTFTSGNKRILEHQQDGTALRIFRGTGGTITYAWPAATTDREPLTIHPDRVTTMTDRTAGLKAARTKDSNDKRRRVLQTVKAMETAGQPITATAVATARGCVHLARLRRRHPRAPRRRPSGPDVLPAAADHRRSRPTDHQGLAAIHRAAVSRGGSSTRCAARRRHRDTPTRRPAAVHLPGVRGRTPPTPGAEVRGGAHPDPDHPG